MVQSERLEEEAVGQMSTTGKHNVPSGIHPNFKFNTVLIFRTAEDSSTDNDATPTSENSSQL